MKNIEIACFILDHLKLPHTFIENVKDRLGHDWRYAMNYSKIKDEFGWKPILNFEDGLLDTIEWYKSNEEWWRLLKI
jgi:dTDP-glucose 4,6-dehydratase